jgi:uncharacterized protein
VQINDREPSVLVTGQVGRTRFRTPEGYLFCRDVRIASTDPLLYRPHEVPDIEPDKGMVLMLREPDVLFSQETLDSYQGKDVTMRHPDRLLNSRTWRMGSVGTVLNPRQGTGDDAKFLVADLLIKDQAAIDAVERGVVELSCGYDADRVQVKPGVGRFTRLIGNHVAFLERGRCGPACAIGDADMPKKTGLFDRLRNLARFVPTKDAAEFEEELKKAEDEASEEGVDPSKTGNHFTINLSPPMAQEAKGEKDGASNGQNVGNDPYAEVKRVMDGMSAKLDSVCERLDKIEQKDAGDDETEEEKKAREDKEKAEKESTDRANKDGAIMDTATVAVTRTEFQEVVSRAEILSPGIKIPVFDAATSRKTMADRMCDLRKSAVVSAFADERRKHAVVAVVGKAPNFDAMPCDQMTIAFNAASAIVASANSTGRVSFVDQNFPQGKMTPAKMQEVIEKTRAANKASAKKSA